MMRKVISLVAGLACFSYSAFALSPFTLPWMNHPTSGTVYKSNDAQGRIFVIENYYNQCPPCNDNPPNVDSLASQFSQEPRVQVLDVGTDMTDGEYRNWILKHHPNHPVLKDATRTISRQLEVTHTPTVVLLDWRFQEKYRYTGIWTSGVKSRLREIILELLKIPPPDDDGDLVHPVFPDP